MAVAATVDQATLKANIDGYMHRTFTAGELAQFVAAASARIGRDVRSTEQERTGSLRPVNGIADLPARCAQLRAIKRVSDGLALQAWGFRGGQNASAGSAEVMYRPHGLGPAGRKQVELWPARTDDTASVSVSSLSSVTTLATAAATAHGYATGDFVEFAGHGAAEYNDTFGPITKVDDDSFTFAVDADFADASSGTITARKVTLLCYYFETPDGSFALGDTNPLLEAHPELYLYAALTEAAVYVRDRDSIAEYRALYELEVQQINISAYNLRAGAAPVSAGRLRPASSSPPRTM